MLCEKYNGAELNLLHLLFGHRFSASLLARYNALINSPRVDLGERYSLAAVIAHEKLHHRQFEFTVLHRGPAGGTGPTNWEEFLEDVTMQPILMSASPTLENAENDVEHRVAVAEGFLLNKLDEQRAIFERDHSPPDDFFQAEYSASLPAIQRINALRAQHGCQL